MGKQSIHNYYRFVNEEILPSHDIVMTIIPLPPRNAAPAILSGNVIFNIWKENTVRFMYKPSRRIESQY